MIARWLAILLVAATGAVGLQQGQLALQRSQTPSCNGSEARPPVTPLDLKIARRAAAILDSPAKWNRADNRKCPDNTRTFSLYCALEEATTQCGGKFEHRSGVMQEARFAVEERVPDWRKYDHRLMGYNNDPKTSFADIQKVFRLLEQRIEQRLAAQAAGRKRFTAVES